MKRTLTLFAALAVCGTAGTALASQHAYTRELQNVRQLSSTVAHKAASLSARIRPHGWRRVGFRQAAIRPLSDLRMAAMTLASRAFGASPGVLASDLAVVRARFREARAAMATISVAPFLREEFESIRGELRAITAAIERMRAFEIRHTFGMVPRPIAPTITYAPSAAPIYTTPGVSVSWYQGR